MKGIGALEGEEPGRTYETHEAEEQNILLVTVPWSDDKDVNGDEDLRDALRPKYLRAFGA